MSVARPGAISVMVGVPLKSAGILNQNTIFSVLMRSTCPCTSASLNSADVARPAALSSRISGGARPMDWTSGTPLMRTPVWGGEVFAANLYHDALAFGDGLKGDPVH